MTDATTIDRPKEQMAKAATPPAGGSPATSVNLQIQNEREWIARYRFFDGEIRGMDNAIKKNKRDFFKHRLGIASAGLKAMFNFRQPMGILTSAFGMAMAVWDLSAAQAEHVKIVMKNNAFKAAIDKHVFLGTQIGSEDPVFSADGTQLHAPEFVDTLKAVLTEPRFTKHAPAYRPQGLG